MPWRGRMDPTQNLFWNYMLFKMRDFLRKITKHDILGNKERGFPMIFNQSKTSHFYYTIV